MRIINPYENIDWENVLLVKGISHEHIYSKSQLKNAWDRGIRWFACVNYSPAVAAAPSLLSWSGTFMRWNYYDVSSAFPNGGIDGGKVYDHAGAVAKIPVTQLIDGLIISYYSTPADITYEKYSSGNWDVVDEEDLDDELELVEDTYSSRTTEFISEGGETINPDDIPALGNAEHAVFKNADGTTAGSHFNVLGNLFGEISAWTKDWYPRAFSRSHPVYYLSQIKSLFTTDLQFEGKYFGTINHNLSADGIKKYLEAGDGLFKAMELFNQGFTKEANQMFRDAYDELLREGTRLNVLAVVDWQGHIETSGYPGQDMSEYVPECDFDRGCNVLCMPSNYESLTKTEKTEAGLDSYLAGTYFASGLGNHSITDLSVSGRVVHFSVTDTPTKIKAITSQRSFELLTTNAASVAINPGETYVRFEVYYADHDFIFTNPVWIEDNSDKIMIEKNLLLLFS